MSYIMVFVEPGMGFTTPADYFDPDKVAAGYASTAWLVDNIIYLTMPFATWVLARGSDDPYLRWSGVAAGLLLFVVGSIDRVSIQLPSLLPDAEGAQAALVVLIPIRFAVLKTMVVAWGVLHGERHGSNRDRARSRRFGGGWVTSSWR